MAFDFSNEFPITFVEFLNFSNGRDLEHMVTQRSKYLGVNVVIITGGDSDIKTYRANLDGITGIAVWQDPYYIGIFMKELLLKHNSKYNIFFGDCGGAYSAILASKHAPVDTLFLCTPTINGKPTFQSNIEVNSVIFKQEIEKSINIDKEIMDAFPILLKNIQMGVKVSMHWSKYCTGSDLYDKTRAMKIPKSFNLEITEYDMPIEMDHHLLSKWLSNTHQLRNILQREIQYARLVLSFRNV